MNKHHEIENRRDVIRLLLANQASEEEILAQMQQLVDFILTHFSEAETGNNALYFSQKFELELSKFAQFFLLIFDAYWNPSRYKYLKIKEYVISLATDEKYKNARVQFVREVGILWADELVRLALNESLWQNDMFKTEFMELLNRKKIGGFEAQAEQIIAQTNPKNELSKLAQRYLKNSPKFKHYTEKFDNLT